MIHIEGTIEHIGNELYPNQAYYFHGRFVALVVERKASYFIAAWSLY
jgi:hypothetical protein